MKTIHYKILVGILLLVVIGGLYAVYLKVPLFNQGGIVMVPLLFCSVYGLFLIIERAVYYHKVVSNSSDLMEKVNKALSENNIEEAYLLCENKETPLSSILITGLNNSNKDKEFIKEAVLEAGRQEIPKLEENLNVLSLIAKISPLMGLLGTVSGMMRAFEEIRLLAGNVNASVLAGGISEALLTTATGLVIAITILVFHNFLSNKADKILLDIESSVLLSIESISSIKEIPESE